MENQFLDFTQKPKLATYYENLAIKNFYNPIFDMIAIQSKWVDFYSKWLNESNNYYLERLSKIVLTDQKNTKNVKAN